MKEELFQKIETLSKFFYFRKKALKTDIIENIETLFNDINSLKNTLQTKQQEIENLFNNISMKENEINKLSTEYYQYIENSDKEKKELNNIINSQKAKCSILEKNYIQEKNRNYQITEINEKLNKELDLIRKFKKYIKQFTENNIIKDVEELEKLKDLKYLLEDIEDKKMVLLEEETFLENITSSFEEILDNLNDILYEVEDIEKYLEFDEEINNIEKIKESYIFLVELFKDIKSLDIGNDKDEIIENIKNYKKDHQYLNYLLNFDKKNLMKFSEYFEFTQDILKHKNIFEAMQIITQIHNNPNFDEIVKQEENIVKVAYEIRYVLDLIKQSVLISKFIYKNNQSFPEIEKEFEKLKNILSSYSKDIFNELDKLKDEIIKLKLFPFNNKIKVGIGGSFASGKTQFLQRIVGSNIKLSIADTPTTAVATYLFYGNPKIQAYNTFDTIINVSFKEFEILNNHKNLKNLNINYFIKFFMISNNHHRYKNLCFIDVPGYNPSPTSSTKKDTEIAKKFLKESDNILWILSIERGTIEKEDLKFLKDLNKKNIYFIINKSDLKDEKDRKAVLRQVKNMLEENDLKYKGISLFNSIKFQELGYEKVSLLKYLAEINKYSPTNIKVKIDRTFKEINQLIYSKIEEIKKDKQTLEEIDKDIFQYLYDQKEVRYTIDEKLQNFYKNFANQLNYYANMQKELKDIESNILKLIIST